MDAFKININGKLLDYRLGSKLNLDNVRKYFELKYKVLKLWNGGRHVLGILEKNKNKYFLKLATTEGISAVTKIEYEWNQTFNNLVPRKDSQFYVPINFESGYFNSNLFYLITDYFPQAPFVSRPEKNLPIDQIEKKLNLVINLSEFIQNLKIDSKNTDHQKIFLDKTLLWFNSIPEKIRENYKLEKTLSFIKNNANILDQKPRHGDFAPWHILPLGNNKLCLLDGEHYLSNGVENYDICYFIQRVYCVLNNPLLAKQIFNILLSLNYNPKKLKVVLLVRCIGGYLDASLNPNPNYQIFSSFQNWVEKL